MKCFIERCYEMDNCKHREMAEHCSMHRDFMIEIYTQRKFFLLPSDSIEEADKYAMEVLGIEFERDKK